MAKTVKEYKAYIEHALKNVNRYSQSLDAQILSIAGALRTLDLANDEIDGLTGVTISIVSRYGNETLAPHPAFKVQKDAQDSVTRQMKALGLTAEDLSGEVEDDPIVDVTRRLQRKRDNPTIIKPEE